jgi:hypothetical protein
MEATKAPTNVQQQATPQALKFDLHPRQKEQEGQADEREKRDRQIDAHPAEHRRANHDTRHDLDHHRGEAAGRREAQQERGQKGNQGNDQHSDEGDIGHTNLALTQKVS